MTSSTIYQTPSSSSPYLIKDTPFGLSTLTYGVIQTVVGGLMAAIAFTLITQKWVALALIITGGVFAVNGGLWLSGGQGLF